jgi:ATP-dependent helicase/DNAse subunit B
MDSIWMQEAPLYSERLSVAGRVDCIAEWDGVLSIIDYKTSRRPKKIEYVQGYFIQESVYAACFFERTGVPIKQIVTVIAVDDNEPQVFIEQTMNHLHKFVALREKYREKFGI